jgi:hypothetical protein
MTAPRVWSRLAGAAVLVAAIAACRTPPASAAPTAFEGQEIFRFGTFGDEAFWTDTLRMHEVIEGAQLGGVGSGVSPATALGVGLKVDLAALPPSLVGDLSAGRIDLNSPATTVALLKLDAVVGVRATVDTNGRIVTFGVTCALCHSTVDNALAPGIGRRLDGWPNRDLQPGLILSLSPALQDAATQAVLTSWGAGKYDARWNHDGKSDPVVIPPAYGLAGINLATYTGEGTVGYWNAYVAVTQMHGRGTFVDAKTGDDVHHAPDLVTSQLPSLLLYQMSLTAPVPPVRSTRPPRGAAPRCLPAPAAARPATCRPSTATRTGACTRQPRPGWIRCSRSGGPPGCIGRPRCAGCGNIRPTSMTGVRPRSRPWWTTTAGLSA